MDTILNSPQRLCHRAQVELSALLKALTNYKLYGTFNLDVDLPLRYWDWKMKADDNGDRYACIRYSERPGAPC